MRRASAPTSTRAPSVFDLPKDDRIVSLELHDSPLSAGVLVAVG